MEKKRLIRLYNIIIKCGNDVLNYGSLAKYGFNEFELEEFTTNGILVKEPDGCYLLGDIRGLYNYGKKLAQKNMNATANTCFERCFSFDPRHIGTLMQLFLKSLYVRDYQSAYRYLNRAFESDPSDACIRDLNFYMFLFGIIYDIEDSFYVSSIAFGDVKILEDDKRYTNIDAYNSIRAQAICGRYTRALSEFEKLVYDRSSAKATHDKIVRELLLRTVEAEKKSKREIINLISNGDIEGVKKYLTEKQKKQPLCQVDQAVLELAGWASYITNSKVVPNKTPVGSYVDTFGAIDNLAFDDALNFCINYVKGKNRISDVPNPILAMLFHICNLLDKIPNNGFSQTTKENLILLKERFDFVSEQYDLVKKQGFIILEPMPDEDINLLRVISKNYEHMDAFCITDVDNKKRVVLKYYQHQPSKGMSVKEMLKRADEFYKSKNYSECIPLYLNLAVRSQKNRSFVYTRLGLSYMYDGRYDKAIDYFMLARNLPELSEFKMQYTAVIKSLDVTKSEYVLSVSEASYDGNEVEFIFGVSVKTLELIQSRVEEGKTVLQACFSIGLKLPYDREKINRILLVYACQCYVTEKEVNDGTRHYTVRPFVYRGNEFCKVVIETNPRSRVAKILRALDARKDKIKITPTSLIKIKRKVRPGNI